MEELDDDANPQSLDELIRVARKAIDEYRREYGTSATRRVRYPYLETHPQERSAPLTNERRHGRIHTKGSRAGGRTVRFASDTL